MSLFRCCPAGCYDDCCEYMAACTFTQPTSVEVVIEVYCTRKWYLNGTLTATVVTADYTETYTATNWSTYSVTEACGTYDRFKSNTLNYKLLGDRSRPIADIPTNSGVGGCAVCGGTLLACPNICGPGCSQCNFPGWEFCVNYEQVDMDIDLEDAEVDYGCCSLNGCFRPCIEFKPDVGANPTTVIGGTSDITENCCGDIADTPGAATASIGDFTLYGRCGCPIAGSFKEVVSDGILLGGSGQTLVLTGPTQFTLCDGLIGPTYADARCACEDFSTTPSTLIENTCASGMFSYEDCCEYTVTVTIT